MLNVRDTDNCKDSADNFIDIVQSAMAVLGKIFHVHAIFFQRDWHAHANFGVHKL